MPTARLTPNSQSWDPSSSQLEEGSAVLEWRKRTTIKDASGSLGVFPQQPERLGVLPIKLRGGLGQPPETWNQVPRGSARFRIKVPLLKVEVLRSST